MESSGLGKPIFLNRLAPPLRHLLLEEKPLTTITDVAKRAGVSPVTVSRVINDAPNVNSATRERVGQAIAELGYVPNVVARSLRSKRTRSLALLVPDITNTFWTTVARGVEDAAQNRGYAVLFCNTDENAAKQKNYLEVVASQRVDGVIVAPCDSDAAKLGTLRDHKIATVTIDRRVDGWEVDSVLGDSLGGAYALVQHLISLGHRRIAMISGPLNTSTAEDRIAGYCLALADAGIPADPRLVKRGEFRSTSGEQLTGQLLDEGLNPTAVFAANNAIAMGVIDALERRGLRIPHDIALVCFDDLANASHLFPFLTVAVQPAYEMGLNAAQLLLSRLDAEVPLKPRRVVLPSRLIVRYSCGSKLRGNGDPNFSLPLPGIAEARSVLVRPLRAEERARLCTATGGNGMLATGREVHSSLQDPATASLHKSDINRLLAVFQGREADRVPHLEFQATHKAVYAYVLEREPRCEVVDARTGRQTLVPEDEVEFAQRLGIDAVTCHFSWRPGRGPNRTGEGVGPDAGDRVKGWAGLDALEPPPPLTDQLSSLERYLRAAQGTGVGVCASLTSFFDAALLAIGPAGAASTFRAQRADVERLMDALVQHQAHVMRVVCDRFGDSLAFVRVDDHITDESGLRLQPELFREVFPHRMERLIEPAREHGKLLAMTTSGKLEPALPTLYDLGFGIIGPVRPECNDLATLRQQWRGRLAFVGNIPAAQLALASREEIEATVRDHCIRLAPGGGYIIGSSDGITEGVPPEKFVAMTQAVHKYGRYGYLGQNSA